MAEQAKHSEPQVPLKDLEYRTAEKKKDSEHPMADIIGAQLHQIIKKSTDTSLSKSKLFERKIEVDKQIMSAYKAGKDSPKAHFFDQQALNSNPIAQPLPTGRDSNKASPRRFEDLYHSNQPIPSRARSRASQGLLNFLSQENIISETNDNFLDDQRNGGDRQHGSVSMDSLAERPSDVPEPEEPKTEKKGIEEVDMEVGKRSRKSYFPEKLLKKVKVDKNVEDENDDEGLQALTQQFKGPFFSLFSHTASNVGLQALFGGLGLGRDDAYSLGKSSGVLEELIEKKETIKSLQIDSLKEFAERLADERKTNLEIIGIDHDKIGAQDPTTDKKPFEKVMLEIVKQKLLLCFDMASRLQLLTTINQELDDKLKKANEMKKSLEEIQLPKAEDVSGEWTEQRLFQKISKEYGFQYFKYSLQRETGQIDVTFAMDDILFFSLHFDRLTDADNETYFLHTGTCKHSPIVNPQPQKALNPLNNPQVLASIYGRIIATSASDNEPSDALNFLVYLGCEQRRLNIIRKSLNLSVAKHKISDIVIDLHYYVIHFLMFPKLAKVNFSLKVSTSLLVSEHANVFVEILSSQHKKKNMKSEVFSELDERVRGLLNNYPAVGQDWLIEIIDRLAEIINQDF